jgi:hypothetical protein
VPLPAISRRQGQARNLDSIAIRAAVRRRGSVNREFPLSHRATPHSLTLDLRRALHRTKGYRLIIQHARAAFTATPAVLVSVTVSLFFRWIDAYARTTLGAFVNLTQAADSLLS